MGIKDLFGNEKKTLQPVLERARQPISVSDSPGAGHRPALPR